MTRIAVSGTCGRMGRSIIESIINDSSMDLVAALERTGNPNIGKDAGYALGKNLGIKITDDLNSLAKADCLIDFTKPDASLKHLDACKKFGTKVVIGTTGFDEMGIELIKRAAQDIAIVFSSNMSIGINLIFKLIKIASEILNSNFDVEILELHHKKKSDAPSGTALKMGEIISSSRSVKLSDIAVWSRYGNSCERQPGQIGFSTMRGGNTPGEHSVYFFGDGEQIQIKHQSNDRSIYSKGAIYAVRFLIDKKSGIYDMQTVLGLS